MELREFVQKLFARATEKGLTECEVYCATGSSFSSSVFKGEIVNYSVSDEIGLGFRALVNGKMGYASTQALDEDAIEMLTDAAKTNAELIGSEDQQFMYEGSGEYAKLELFSPAVEALSAAEKIALARTMEEKALAADPRIEQVANCAVFSESQEVTMINTKGLDVSFKGNILAGYVVPVARESEEVSSAFGMFVSSDPEKVDLDAVVKQGVGEAIDGLKWDKVPSGEYPVVIRADAMADLLRTFSDIFSADSAQKGTSLLKGREGEVIAADCVTIVDDPHLEGSVASQPFDGEGVPTRRKEIVKAGTLTTLMHNLKTAHKQGVETTANASRASYGAPVGVSPSNFFLQPGEDCLDTLLSEAEGGLLITDLQGLHSGANEISGDFSLSAKGYKIEGGKKAGSIRQITVAGNFYELMKNVTRVGSDLWFGFPGSGRYGSPSVLVKKLSIAGK